MRAINDIGGYKYSNADVNDSHGYLIPVVRRELAGLGSARCRRLFELGCGNGSVAAILQNDGWEISGVDPSIEGIAAAKSIYPHLRLEVGSAYDDLAAKYGQFPIVLSLEVVEHVFSPRDYAQTLFNLTTPGGSVIVSTPYHSYLKNLVLALSGKMDNHFTALWDNGHIKFWSVKTLKALLEEAGFCDVRFSRVGRIPHLAKSMVAIARKV